MTAPDIWTEEVFVSAYDVDFQNQWKPASLFSAIQRIGSKHADSLGYSYERMTAMSRAWILSRIKVRFYQLPGAGETVTIQTAPKGVQQKIFFVRDSQVVDSAGTILAGATTAWLVIDLNTWRILPVPALGFELPQPTGFVGLDETLEKIVVPDDGSEGETVLATYNTLDVLGHVNNARYAEWLTDCFPVEQYRTHRIDSLQINYTNEVRPGERVTMCLGKANGDPDQWVVQGINKENGKRNFEGAVRWVKRSS
jgi:medium-chain acyl-[acyl-carrier-protein] hydrolase